MMLYNSHVNQPESNQEASVDLDILRKPVSRAEVVEYVKSLAVPWLSRYYSRGYIALAICLILASLVWLVWALAGSSISGVLGATSLGVVGVYVLGVAWSTRSRYVKEITLRRFAESNNLLYVPQVENAKKSGMIFNVVATSTSSDMIQSTPGSRIQFEMGRLRYVVGSGKNRSVSCWRYLVVKIDRHVPHAVLDSTKNNLQLFGMNLLSNLPVTVKDGQELALEGDFNKYFKLFVPVGYERDALYIFTPDLMALLIDNANDFDAEMVDDQLYFYQREDAFDAKKIWSEDYYTKVFDIVNNIGQKIKNNTDYYSDERVGDRALNVVAPEGRRLKTGVTKLVVFMAVIYIIYYAIKIYLELSR